MNKFHLFDSDISGVLLPETFTCPFSYKPHKLVSLAAEQLCRYINGWNEVKEALDEGKMFGVLVVKRGQELGFVAAFSGNICNENKYEYFVPPIYDLLNPSGFFKQGESELDKINERISQLENGDEYKSLCSAYSNLQKSYAFKLNEHKCMMAESKKSRDEKRAKGISDEENKQLIKESQFQKAEFKRLQKAQKEDLAKAHCPIERIEEEINRLKSARIDKSKYLQDEIFKSYVIINSKGETKNLLEIFVDAPQGYPPSGSGECAAPKMLQYAFQNGLKPVVMGEFWWGKSPVGEIRHHGEFYPSCISKCRPILNFMLDGMEIEKPYIEQKAASESCRIIYEDEYYLAVNKPEGLMSVPGKLNEYSVLSQISEIRNDIKELFVVHRLDMATSGVLILAKSKTAYTALQGLFEARKVDKKYIALLDGTIANEEGRIELPLMLDYENRPQQMVSDKGKYALTYYKVVERSENRTLVEFIPVTGRTHQLRVHAAHIRGLNAPIVGDTLYGRNDEDERLFLHAEMVSFIHPFTGEKIVIKEKTPFGINGVIGYI